MHSFHSLAKFCMKRFYADGFTRFEMQFQGGLKFSTAALSSRSHSTGGDVAGLFWNPRVKVPSTIRDLSVLLSWACSEQSLVSVVKRNGQLFPVPLGSLQVGLRFYSFFYSAFCLRPPLPALWCTENCSG